MINSSNNTVLWALAAVLVVFVAYLLLVGLCIKRGNPKAPPPPAAGEDDGADDYNWLSTTDRAQLQDESGDAALWRRQQPRPHIRAGAPVVNPFPQPDLERRRP